jgi:cell surface protein SprA
MAGILMMLKKLVFLWVVYILCVAGLKAQGGESSVLSVLQGDSIDQKDTFYPAVDQKSNNPFLSPEQKNQIELNQAENITYTANYDPVTGQVVVYGKIGDRNIRLPYTMTLDEYLDEDIRASLLAYWKERASAEVGEDKFNIFNPVSGSAGGIENILGSNLISIKAQGLTTLKIGVSHTTIDNPSLTEEERNTTTFEFEESIQMNVEGKIGDKVNLGINYNTDATFDSENEVSLSYTGEEDDIIQSIEAGDVSMDLDGSLITGSESLFGVKTDLKFGKLDVSAVISQQQSTSTEIELDDGAQTTEFEIEVLDYDANRHYFLSNYFRDLFEDAAEDYPMNSKIEIQSIEVWVTNSSGDYTDTRDIVAFMDLGESGSNVYNSGLWAGTTSTPASNSANNLYSQMTSTYAAIRDIDDVTSTLKTLSSSDFEDAQDYEKVQDARLLSSSEYTINEELGFISLNTALDNDEVLAVAVEYDYSGTTYYIGEFSSDLDSPSALILKMLKSSNSTPDVELTWDLMMKNIYSLGGYQIDEDDFELNVAYEDDDAGTEINYFPDASGIEGDLLLEVMGLDKLNSSLSATPNGEFDFLEDQTIYADKGKIIFPYLEPFGSHLYDLLDGYSDLQEKYVYQSLYDETQTEAEEDADLNKFLLTGSYKASITSEIYLNVANLVEGSVVVKSGGITLTENEDYTIDYTMGILKIIDEGVLSSGNTITVSLESDSYFNTTTKTMLGVDMDYHVNDKLTIGGTIMHYDESSYTEKVNVGNEPASNVMMGLNASYNSESQWITNTLNKLPFLTLTEPSSVSLKGEFAYLFAGTSNDINGEAYIDDFESSETDIDVSSWSSWEMASVPQGQEDMFPEAELSDDLEYGFNRAKLAWYTVDPLFFYNNSSTPDNIKNDPDEQSDHYSRLVYEEEIWPEMDSEYGTSTNISVLNLAYYPTERGPYNFDTDVNSDGELNSPEDRWAGIMREMTTTNFESANISYIEFWMLDPFINDDGTDEGGDLYINLGSISEDILNDSRKFFEQGIPGPDEDWDVDTTSWGFIPTSSTTVNAFSSDSETILAQDVGLDGMDSDDEVSFFTDFMTDVQSLYAAGNLSADAYEDLQEDPASDDYHYFRGTDYDEDELSILDRYKLYNGPEGNSCPSDYSPESYSTASTTIPEQEDINEDNTLSETESYYQYKITLDPNNMEVGNGYIYDSVEADVDLENGETETVNWYQFRIPIYAPDTTIGSIDDFSSIRFMRMFLRNFKQSTVLRFATLDLVRSDWTIYSDSLAEDDEVVNYTGDVSFDLGTVNIEENSDRSPINYVLPPGVSRSIDGSSSTYTELNEQSISLTLTNLGKNERKAVYKSTSYDLRDYGHMEMEVHAEEDVEGTIDDNMIRAFIRLGSDYTDNYYEYEVPLSMTDHGATDADEVWPTSNRFDFDMDLLTETKVQRDEADYSTDEVYSVMDGSNYVRVKGSPNLGDVETIMLGVRSLDGDSEVDFEVWFNELKVSDFKEDGGWAATTSVDVKLSDLGNVAMAWSKSTAGYGSLDESLSERNDEDYEQFDIASSLELGKFTGVNSRWSIPFYFSLSNSKTTPKYYPLDEDLLLEDVLDRAESDEERAEILDISVETSKSKSINFTNVGVSPKKGRESKVFDVSNVNISYAYNETEEHDIDTEYDIEKEHTAKVDYSYKGKPKAIEPFKNSKLLKGKAFKLITDFNFYLFPKEVSYSMEFYRYYNESLLRDLSNSDYVFDVTVDKSFSWDRSFTYKHDLSKSLSFDFSSTTNSEIDEPDGVVDSGDGSSYENWKDSVLTNILNGGRITNYQHEFNVSYTIPVNKLPYLDWVNSSFSYSGEYAWEAEADGTDDETTWGNEITNSNSWQYSGQLNFNTLYNKSNYLKSLTSKYSSKRKTKKSSSKKTVRYNKDGINLKKGTSYIINHKLKTKEVRVRMFDSNGRTVRGETVSINESKTEFIPSMDAENARVMVTGTVEDKSTVFGTILDYSSMLVTGLKSLSLSYSESNSTYLPGFLPGTKFLGNTTYGGDLAPGFGFITGMQDRDFAQKAGDRGWLTTDSINEEYTMSHSDSYSIKTTLKPLPGLEISLNAARSYSRNLSEYYYADEIGAFDASSTRVSGSFSMTYLSIGTAFKSYSKSGNYKSGVYDTFLSNREIIADRVSSSREGLIDDETGEIYDIDGVEEGKSGYSLTSQDVMVPAFLAAYSGQNANSISTSLFPAIYSIFPNWSISYSGLSNFKFIQRYLKSISLSHAYKSTYSTGSYATSSYYEEADNGFSWIRNSDDDFYSKYGLTTVTISEYFSPLISAKMVWNNKMTSSAEISKSRTLSLGLTSNQLVEYHKDELSFSVGYTFDRMDLILGKKGSKQKNFSSDLDLSANFSFADQIYITRDIEEGDNEVTSGSQSTTVGFTANYALSDKFTMQLYYDRTYYSPYVSSSYATTTSSVGVSFSFAITQQ